MRTYAPRYAAAALPDFEFHCGIFATVSSFFREAILQDEFLALLSRRNNMQGACMTVFRTGEILPCGLQR